MREFRNKGIAARTLVDLIKNTAPFLFTTDPLQPMQPGPNHGYWSLILDADKNPEVYESDLEKYFSLCISAHFSTVATFVPTDVDHAIRIKLWKDVHTEPDLEKLWSWVCEFEKWDESPVSKRFIETSKGRLSGHAGEWFSIAAGAYATALRLKSPLAREITLAIRNKVNFHRAALVETRTAFQDDRNESNTFRYLSALAIVAHNLGDLDRVITETKISEDDFLSRAVYRLGHGDAKTEDQEFVLSGELYKKLMAAEAHRHLPLREAKALRKSRAFLLGFGPLLDEWGMAVSTAGQTNGLDGKPLWEERDFRDFFQALIEGWKRLNVRSTFETQGYSRALIGAATKYPDKLQGVLRLLPPILAKEVNEGGLRTLISISRAKFHADWAKRCADLLHDRLSTHQP